MKTKLKSILAVALCAVGLSAFAGSEISAVSAEGFLDLTVGDRVAKDAEPIVVDPAWGKAETASVAIEGESSPRTYMCASNDTWQTAALEPGRYALALRAGDDNETAAFWKTGADWVVFDSSNITADVTFEAGKTYLVLGTNTVNGATLKVADSAKFAYDENAPAGFLGGTLAELPRRYRKEVVEGDLYRIVEAIKGCEDNPWVAGGDVSQPENVVEAYTNGTELVVTGTGTITDLSEIPGGVKDAVAAITISESTVKGAADDAFAGFSGVEVTLPDNWQGALPENGSWYGATGVTLTSWPKAVKNVKVQQRYPWNGLVDVNFDLMGAGSVQVSLSVTVDGKKLKNPTVTSGTTFDLGTGMELKGLRLTWGAGTDFGDDVVHEKIKVKLTVSPAEAD